MLHDLTIDFGLPPFAVTLLFCCTIHGCFWWNREQKAQVSCMCKEVFQSYSQNEHKVCSHVLEVPLSPCCNQLKFECFRFIFFLSAGGSFFTWCGSFVFSAGSSGLGSPLGRSRHSSSQSDLTSASNSSSGLSFTACMSDFSLYVFHPYGAGKQKTAVSGLTSGSGGLGIFFYFFLKIKNLKTFCSFSSVSV